jgi:SAM-dependent methyltransferase
MVSMGSFERYFVNRVNRLRVPGTVLRLLDRAGVAVEGTVLEIGAGLGYTSHALFKKYHPERVFICDYDPVQVAGAEALAKKEFGEVPPGFTFCCEDVLALSFGDETFDLVISTLMFHHVELVWRAFDDTPAGIAEIQRVLKLGGVFLFWDIVNQDKIERLLLDAGYALLLSTRRQRVFKKP